MWQVNRVLNDKREPVKYRLGKNFPTKGAASIVTDLEKSLLKEQKTDFWGNMGVGRAAL